MSTGKMVRAVVRFVRAGYPDGMPPTGHVPLLALLPRRLSDDEVATVASTLMSGGGPVPDRTTIAVAITKVTGALPSQSDTSRVTRRILAAGRPLQSP
jgi:Protein of unknown function (DUF3349)